jgi:mono/diheme cytochrome c family protein
VVAAISLHAAGTAVGVPALAVARLSPPSTTAQSSAVPPIDRRLLDQYCVSCHNERLRTGGLTLDKIDVDRIGANADVWEKVVRKLRGEQMPPTGRPRPDKPAAAAFVSSLEAALDRAGAAAPNPGRPVTHRLNRTEYTNAIRDLLALEIDARSLLPADDTDEHGFDNNGEVLSISPALLERYLSAARRISRLAVGRPPAAPSIDTYTIPARLTQDDRIGEKLPFGSRGGAAITHHFPVDGEYAFTIQLQKTLYNAVRGLAEPHQLEVRIDRQRVKVFTIGGAPVVPPPASFAGTLSWNPEWERYANHADEGLEVRVPVKAGARLIGISFVKRAWEAEDVLQPPRTGWGFGTDEMFDGSPGLESVTVQGPFGAGEAGDTPSRRKLFTCRPKRETEEEACARTILSALARRAYRRPVADDDVKTLIGFYRSGRREGRFEAGVEAAVRRILISPDFLFRLELEPERLVAGAQYRVSNIALASRLSFFLWSSIPDEELLDLAARGKLQDPAVLERQVRRMLTDPRASSLVVNFAAQWLQLRDLRNVVPDPDLFPEWDESLRDAFRQETELFIQSQLREDRGIVDLLTANHTFANEQLARFYGIAGVYGSRFRRVPLPGDERGGLLGHGSILTLSSYPNRTSPVLRGKWLLENILGSPPPPPPPDVPALKDKGANGERRSVRERLQEHRRNPVCATCHSQMDPLGFALENFNAIGMWRTIDEARTPIDSSGALPSGATFQGLNGLRTLLLARREQFVATVAERLLAYALGRGIEYYDRPTLRQILRDAASSDYRWSSVVLGIVRSAPFQMRRAES